MTAEEVLQDVPTVLFIESAHTLCKLITADIECLWEHCVFEASSAARLQSRICADEVVRVVPPIPIVDLLYEFAGLAVDVLRQGNYLRGMLRIGR